jgi:uncharacterized protein YkwD
MKRSTLLLLFCLTIQVSFAQNQTGNTTQSSAFFPSSSMATPIVDKGSLEVRAFELINEIRKEKGMTELVWDSELLKMAHLHSENMAEKEFFSHEGPDGSTLVKRARHCKVQGWKALGENIAYNLGYSDPAGFAVERWMGSEGHRLNLLRSAFTHTAIGVAIGRDGRVLFTQVFAAR